jgi:hypothetical protein
MILAISQNQDAFDAFLIFILVYSPYISAGIVGAISIWPKVRAVNRRSDPRHAKPPADPRRLPSNSRPL